MKQILISIFITVLLLSGCSSTDVRNDSETATPITSIPAQTDMMELETDDNDEISFGWDTETEDMDTFVYNGNTLSIPFKLGTKKATGHDIGFLVFIGGIQQNYSVEFSDGTVTDESTMYRFKLTEIEEKHFNILVNPSVGKKGEKLGIYVCSVLYPSFMPENIDKPSYKGYHALSQVVPQQVKFKADTKKQGKEAAYTEDGLELSEDIIKSIKAFSSNSSKVDVEEKLKDNLCIDLCQKSIDETYITSEKGKVILHIRLYGGVDGIYRTTIFINHKPISVNGADYIQSEVKAATMSECEIVLDVSDYEKLNTIYAITVPADDSYLTYMPAIKSKSVLLVNE